MNTKNYCMHCMHELENVTELKCPFCGASLLPKTPTHHLRPGTILSGEYLVGEALGQGGFGITYIGRDLGLDRIVAIKEFYPIGLSNRNNDVTSCVAVTLDEDKAYEAMKKRFLDEARVLAKFGGLGGVVNVMRYFAENNTAYFVMEYLRGTDLRQVVKERGPLSGEELFPLLRPVMQALEMIHAEGVIHRDISPDNLLLQSDGTLKLLDFGAARQLEGNKSLSVELKHGYAPVEQYSGGGQGPWTDVYALCATIYFCLTGVKPPQSVLRAMDGDEEMKAPSALGAKLEPRQEAAILRGLAVRKSARFQSMKELEDALFADPCAEPPRLGIAAEPPAPPAREEKKEEKDEKKIPAPAEDERTTRAHREKTRAGEKTGNPGKKKRGGLIAAVLALALVLGGAIWGLSHAKVQIGEVKYARSATHVRLSGLALTEADLKKVAGMKKMTSLTILNCSFPSDGAIGLPSALKILDVENCDRFCLEGSLTELTDLELENVGSLTGLENLARCEQLKILQISGCGGDAAAHIGEIAALPQLHTLYLEDLGAEADFAPLGGMTQLKKLSLSGNRLGDPAFLSSLTTLETLRLDRCGLTDLSALSPLTALRSVSLNDNEITALTPFTGAIDLADLSAARNRIGELDGLSNCTRLKNVDLSGNRIADASILAKSAPYLVSLDLSDNRLTELSFLNGAGELKTLRADGNRIPEADLGTLAKLETLSLRSCGLGSLTPGDTKTLVSVDLFDNKLDELTLPESEPKLKYLDLSYNALEALRVPNTQERLTLIVSGNPLVDLRFVDPYEELAWLILDNCPDALLCSAEEGNLSDAFRNLNIFELAFRYPSAGLEMERMRLWKASRYHVGETPLDRVADLKDALDDFRVKLVDSLWELTEQVRRDPVGLASPPPCPDYGAAPDGAAA
ncbi:MAG: protein kinase [Oscillospiraceae bacterium]|nr:protein kinase [Oscillospiraceae bacterium]